MRALRIVVLCGLGLAVLVAFGLGTSLGASPATPYSVQSVESPAPQLKGRWAERAAAAGDLNGDRVPDFFVAVPMEDVNGVADTGRVYAVNGRNRAVLYAIDSPAPQTNSKFGFYISVVGDENGDRVNDIAVGTDAQDVYTGAGAPCGAPEPNGCNEDQGEAWLFSGANGALLRTFENPAPQGSSKNSARFGSRIGRAGDLNGDGRAEIIIGASNNDVPAGCGDVTPLPPGCRINQGQAFIFDGATGALLRTLDLPASDYQPAGTCSSSCGSFGISVQGPGDTNGDGVTDQLVDAGSYSYYTGSGTPCGAPEPNGCNESQGREYVFSGTDGTLLLRIDDPEPQAGATFGFQDAAPLSPGDVDRDKRADLYANGFVQNGPAGEGQGKAWVFSGRDGHLLYELRDPTPEVGGQFGWSLSSTLFNKDRVPDLYVGQSPHHVAGASGSGGTYVFDGRNGALLKALELPVSDRQQSSAGNLGPNLGWANAAPGDLNRDGQPDFVAGEPFEDVGSNQDQGRLLVFLSSDRTAPGKPRVRVRRGVAHFSATDADNRSDQLRFRCATGKQRLHNCRASVRVRHGSILRVQALDPAGNRSRVARVRIR